MTTVERTVEVSTPVELVWSYLSDFSTSAQWDPHTAACRRLGQGPIGIGSQFENVQRLASHETKLVYSVTEYDEAFRIVLEGGNKTVHTRDEMTFKATPTGGTAVTYTVDFQLLGLARAGQPFAPLILKRIADQGAAGMLRTLEAMFSPA